MDSSSPLPAEKTVGFVGVGRMGANMARRLKDQGWTVAAVHDTHAPSADALAKELGAEACHALDEVSARARTIITVVTDDEAMRRIFDAGDAHSLLAPAVAKGRLFVNCATVSPAVHHAVQSMAELAGAQSLEASHGLEHHPGARGLALPDVRRHEGSLRAGQAAAG